jgi:hypothetical protein
VRVRRGDEDAEALRALVALWDAEGLPECEAVSEPRRLGESLPVTLAIGRAVEESDAEPEAVTVGERVRSAERVGEGEPEAVRVSATDDEADSPTLPLSVPLGEMLVLADRELPALVAVTLDVAESEEREEAEGAPTVAVGVLLGVFDAVAEGEDVREAPPVPVALREGQLEAELVPEKEASERDAEGDAAPLRVAEPRVDTDAESDTVDETHWEGEGAREGVSAADGVGEAELESVSDVEAHSVGDTEGLTVSVGGPLGAPEGVAKSEPDAALLPVGEG